MVGKIIALGLRFISAERGSVAIFIGLLLTAIIGVGALGTEFTFLLYKQRQMQSAADSAAMGAATAYSAGYPADPAVEARGISASIGFVQGTDGVTITVNRPPVSGANTGNAAAVQVLVKQPQTLRMASVFGLTTVNVAASAVALSASTGNYCMLQLNAGSATGIAMSNGATVNLTQCGVALNSTSGSSLSVIGGATLNTLSVYSAGGVVSNNGGVINATNGTKINQAAIPDPYAGVAIPTFSGCGGGTNKSFTTSKALPAGVYCSNLTLGGSATITMSGTYYIDRGTFTVGGGVKLTGTNVTIILTSSTASSYAKAVISNGANVTLSAPTSGATSGLVFFGDRRAPLSNTNSFAGGSTTSITGAIYLPSQTMSLSNGTSNASSCTQLIAGAITFVGGSNFNNNCSGTGTTAIGASKSTLVE